MKVGPSNRTILVKVGRTKRALLDHLERREAKKADILGQCQWNDVLVVNTIDGVENILPFQ